MSGTPTLHKSTSFPNITKPSRSFSTNSNSDQKETNIQVVVRCRPRNDKEGRENSPAVVSVNGIKSRELVIRPNSSDRNLTKTYTFDKVFGPDANQEHIYNDVVSPILEEVLMGYNCTIFAYGQTGTGKTYTMEGNLIESNGTYSEHAGVIPRTLYKLFDILESDSSEYSVRVSFTELYNEELKDLLSPEDDFRRLRIYEDASRKGVVIGGLEEVIVKNAVDVITVLQKGSRKRQIAATNFNENSSRSHCVFCITVHIRETTPEGEELLKIGKLNLVDLAGSENIGRSGAENKRAREAGMINQSLLTLGRVINALVEHSPHIPYRESKLTRLLQDSLGGRTKTCIIATVSPAKCNLEETMSTLDYAHRAKNIRNKPEINQKMTKRSLIKDYVNEIEKLKSDLMASRDKNGIYLAPDRYKQLTEDNESRKTMIEELKKSIEAKEELIKQAQEKFQHNMKLLSETKANLSQTKSDLEDKVAELAAMLEELADTKKALEEQSVLTDAHIQAEQRLSQVMEGLVATLQQTDADVQALQIKIDRQTSIASSNQQTVHDYKNSFETKVSILESRLQEFGTIQTGIGNSLCNRLKEFAGQFEANKNSLMEKDELHQQSLNELRSKLTENLNSQSQSVSTSLNNVRSIQRNLSTDVTKHHRDGMETLDLSLHQLLNGFNDYQSKMSLWFNGMQNDLATLLHSLQDRFKRQDRNIADLSAQVAQFTDSEATRFENTNNSLELALTQSANDSESMKRELLTNISQLVDQFAATRQSNFVNVVRNVQSTMTTQSQETSQFSKHFENTGKAMVEESTETLNELSGKIDTLRNAVVSQEETSMNSTKALVTISEHVKRTAIESLDQLRNTVDDSVGTVSTAVDEALSTNQNHHTQCTETMESIAETNSNYSKSLTKRLEETNKVVGAAVNNWHEKISTATDNSKNLVIGMTNETAKMKTEAEEFSLKRYQTDQPTGSTPRKRQYKYPLSWPLTRSHDEIISEYRTSKTVTSEPIPFSSIFDPEIYSPVQTIESQPSSVFKLNDGSEIDIAGNQNNGQQTVNTEKIQSLESRLPKFIRKMPSQTLSVEMEADSGVGSMENLSDMQID